MKHRFFRPTCRGGFLTALLLSLFFASTSSAQSPPEAVARYRNAVLLYNNAQWELAADEFAGFLKAHPKDPLAANAWHFLGVSRLQGGDDPGAVDALAHLPAEYPKFDQLDQSYFYLGFAQYRLGQEGDAAATAKAIESLSAVIAKFPKSSFVPQATYYQAEALYAAGKANEAVAAYQALIKNHADHQLVPDAMYGLGWAYEELKQYDAASALYDDFLKRFPTHALAAEIKLRKGETLLAKRDFAGAIALFEQAAGAEGFASADHALFQWAECAFQLGDFAKAAELYLSIPARFPKSPDAPISRMNACKALMRAESYAKAREAVGPLIAGEGDLADEAVHLSARCLIAEKNAAAAFDLLAKRIEKCGDAWRAQLLLDRGDAAFEIPDRRAQSPALYAEVVAKAPDHPLAANALYLVGYSALQTGDYAKTIASAEQFAKKYPQHALAADVGYGEAEARLLLRQFAEAQQRLEQLIAEHPKHRDARLWQKRLGYALFLQDKWQEAVDRLSPVVAAIKTPADAAEVYCWIGESQQHLKQLDKARASLEASLKSDPRGAVAMRATLALAECLSNQNDLPGAIALLDKTVADPPSDDQAPAAWYRLGSYLARAGKRSDAAARYEHLLKTWPSDPYVPYALHGLGLAQFGEQQYDGAVASYSTLLEKHVKYPLSADVRLDRAQALQASQKYEPALADAEAFLQGNPPRAKKSAAMHVAGVCQDRLKRSVEAVATFRKLLEEDPKYAAADGVLYELGWSLKALDTDEARAQSVETFARLVADHPGSPLAAETHAALAAHYYDSRQYKKAIASYEAAAEKLPPGDAGQNVVHFLGRSYYQDGQFAKAQAQFERQAKTWPEASLAADGHFMLGESLFRQRLFDKALAPYQQANQMKLSSKATAPLSLLRAGQCLGQLQKWSESLPPLEKIVAEHADSYYLPDALYEIGWAKRNLADAAAAEGNAKQAAALYAEAVRQFQSAALKSDRAVGARARFMIGEINFLQKDHKQAVRNYFLVAMGYPQADDETKTWKSKAAYSLGLVYLAMQNGADAKKWFSQTIESYGDLPEASEAKKRLAELGAK